MTAGVKQLLSSLRNRDAAAAQFVRFLAIGVINTAFGYSIFTLLILAGTASSVALLLAYIVGVAFNFWTTGRWVFGQFRFQALPRFVVAYALVYLVNLGLFTALERTGCTALVAQALCLPAVAVFTFVLFRVRVFRSPL